MRPLLQLPSHIQSLPGKVLTKSALMPGSVRGTCFLWDYRKEPMSEGLKAKVEVIQMDTTSI